MKSVIITWLLINCINLAYQQDARDAASEIPQDMLAKLAQYKREYQSREHSSYRLTTRTAFHHYNRLLQTESFNYSTQGANWEGLCANGTQQSPIDLPSLQGTCDNTMMLDIQFNTTNQTMTVLNNNLTVRVSGNLGQLYATDVYGNLYGYNCVQFHFHAPSEHQWVDTTYDAELHMVCQMSSNFVPKDRTLAVLGIPIKVDDSKGANPLLAAIDLTSFTPSTINMNNLLGSQLPAQLVYYTYPGSLTTPPCTEAVNWYVVQSPITVTTDQINFFRRMWQNNAYFANGTGYGNNRPVQSLNGRTVKLGGAACQEQFVYFFSFFILYVFINYFIFKLL